jgi:excisionase family DNA binding protein
MSEDSEELLSVQEAADRLNLTRVRVNQLIDEGKLPAKKVGRSYVIKSSNLHLVEKRNKAGRPPKVNGENKEK